MSGKLRVRTVMTAAILAAFGFSGQAYAVYEIEPNTFISPQPLTISSGGGAEVTAAMGVLTGPAVLDVDIYGFEGREGDVVTIDIDGGMKAAGSGGRSVDTVIAIFGQDGRKLRENDDAGLPLDPGSVHQFDSRITNFRLPATGVYRVGVSSFPRLFLDGGATRSSSLTSTSNGSYTLLITGVTPPVQQINIEIKPGTRGESAPINPKSKGNIPVALLSSPEFSPMEADTQSLSFGANGDEASLLRCAKEGEDINGDGKPDLVCHFDTQSTGFEHGDIEGTLMGRTQTGRQFEGRGLLKVVPMKRED